MIYLINLTLLFGTNYAINSSRFRYKQRLVFTLSLVTLVIFWLIPSLQYGVGKDYFSYMWVLDEPERLFSLYLVRNKEWLFYLLTAIVSDLSLNKQWLFVFSYGITTLSMLASSYYFAGKKGMFVFMILFVTISGIYHGQMNTLRQHASLSIFILSYALLYKGKTKLAIVTMFFSVGFHLPVLIPYVLLFFTRAIFRFDFSKLRLYHFAFVILSVVTLSAFGFSSSAFDNYYLYYVERSVPGSFSLAIISKLYYLPLLLAVFYLLNTNKISANSKDLVKSATVMFSIFYACISLYFINENFMRFFFYFQAISVILFYHIYISITNETTKKLAALYIIIPYLLKVIIFPRDEYLYHSVFPYLNSITAGV